MAKMQTYATEKGAKAAVRKQGLHLMPHRFEKLSDGKVSVIFEYELREDRDELIHRGFGAEKARGE